jgi:hypothetical protein
MLVDVVGAQPGCGAPGGCSAEPGILDNLSQLLQGQIADPAAARQHRRMARRSGLDSWASRLDELGIRRSGVKQPSYTANAMLTFRDPDNFQLEFSGARLRRDRRRRGLARLQGCSLGCSSRPCSTLQGRPTTSVGPG